MTGGAPLLFPGAPKLLAKFSLLLFMLVVSEELVEGGFAEVRDTVLPAC
jgi:hypothetical protein